MPNMSYCRFENTYSDLMECYDQILEGNPEDLSLTEKEYYELLIDLCREIANTVEND